MVLGKLLVPGHLTIRITVGQEPTGLAVGAGGGCLVIITLDCPFYPLSRGWSGGAMVLGKLPVPGRPTDLEHSREGLTALAVGAG